MYRKFSADYIFNGYEFGQHQVLITDATGKIVELIAQNEAGDAVEKLQGILCPGFVNAHCHLELSHMKGLVPKHTGLVDFVLKIVNERHFAADEIVAAIETAENEMLQSGIVAVGDICNNNFTISQKSKGRLQYHNFIETSGFIPAFAKERFDKSVEIFSEFQTADQKQITTNNQQRTTLSPHAPYSVSPEMFAMINNFPNNNLLTIHNQETAAENFFVEKGEGDMLRLYRQMGIDISFYKPSGRSSLQTWLPYFTKNQSIILVHNVCTSETDLKFANARQQTQNMEFFYCLCPRANQYISNTLPEVNTLMMHTQNIVLGTDSLASNDQLSILEEMKTLQNNFEKIDLGELLKWATSNGSKALQMHDKLGSFDTGKTPGLVLINAAEGLKLGKTSSAKRIL